MSVCRSRNCTLDLGPCLNKVPECNQAPNIARIALSLINMSLDRLLTYTPVNTVRDTKYGLSVGYGLHDGTLGSLVQTVQLSHILLVQLEIVNVDIANDTRWRVALGKRDEALL